MAAKMYIFFYSLTTFSIAFNYLKYYALFQCFVYPFHLQFTYQLQSCYFIYPKKSDDGVRRKISRVLDQNKMHFMHLCAGSIVFLIY